MISFKFTGFLILSSIFLTGNAAAVDYDVSWLDKSCSFQRLPNADRKLEIYCYAGATKTILQIWQTVEFHVKVEQDTYRQYVGGDPADVYSKYQDDRYTWSVNLFQPRQSTVTRLDPFNTTCTAVVTEQRHVLSLKVNRFDLWRVTATVGGLALFFASSYLSANALFFYLCGITVGVCASFIVLVYYTSKLFPTRPLMYGTMVGGWTVGLYLLQLVWSNLTFIMSMYQEYVFWYIFIIGFVSFLVCYKIGPPKNEKNRNFVKWTLQVIGLVIVYFSSNYQDAVVALDLVALGIEFFPKKWLYVMRAYWQRRFPPKRRLLTNEEYYEEGARETMGSLQRLRKFCSSPDCAQWKIMLKLNDSKRFASFVEGASHLNDEEVLGYESYAFSANNSRASHSRYNNSLGSPIPHENDLLTDSDSSDY